MRRDEFRNTLFNKRRVKIFHSAEFEASGQKNLKSENRTKCESHLNQRRTHSTETLELDKVRIVVEFVRLHWPSTV